ncbi:COG1361 S-layer family protein [Anaerococcus martiniensis]|uniref:COG1361 S-layer family protein n=1 Tax=Anaerococcus sp. WGS1579 TaxID=3366809 RepID=UPI00372D2C62
MTYYQQINGTENTNDQAAESENAPVQMRNQPKLIISNYSISPKTVEAGGDFNLAFTLYNTNNKNSIYNLKVSIDQQLQSQPQASGENNALVSDGSVFTPVNTSNSFYVSALYPWNSTTKYITMKVNPNAVAGNYVIGLTLEYEDYLGNQYQTKESIGIPVVQRANVTIGEVKHEDLMVDSQTQVSVNIYNTGKDNLNTFMCDVIGKGFTIDNDRRFIGNFNSGSTETFTFNITPSHEGPVEGKIMLSYEDSAGNIHTETKDFYADVTSMGGGEGFEEGMIEDPETGEMIPVDQGMEENMDAGGSLLSSPFLWIGLIIILALVGLLIRKHKKNKKNEELIIDDEDI